MPIASPCVLLYPYPYPYPYPLPLPLPYSLTWWLRGLPDMSESSSSDLVRVGRLG